MLAGEDRSTWGDAEYIQAATLWIHLLDPSRQHSGWTPLNTGEDLLGLTFNMQAENLPERKKVAARIVPPKRVSNGDTHTVELFSWTIISGPVHHWTFVFTPHGVRHSKEQLGRFGGGGYD